MGPSGRFLGDIRVISQIIERICSTTAYGCGAAVTQNRKQIEINLFLQKNRQEMPVLPVIAFLVFFY
jgi:hypothetical protein